MYLLPKASGCRESAQTQFRGEADARGLVTSRTESRRHEEHHLPRTASDRPLLDRLTFLWSREFGVYGALDDASAEIRAKHLRGLTRLAPFTLGASILNGAIAWNALRHTSPGPLLTGWIVSLMLVALFGLSGWWKHRGMDREQASPHAISRAVRHATLLAFIWSSLPVLWYPTATMSQRLIIAMLTTGMLGGGAMALAPVPVASIAYVVVMAVGSCLAIILTHEPLMVSAVALVVIYSLTMIASAISTARVSVARLMSEREASHQSHVIGLLLRDFEEHAADVLWEIDRVGRLTHVSPRLAALLGGDPVGLQGEPFLELLATRRPTSIAIDAPDTLRQAIDAGVAFRDVIVPVATGGQTRWWSITAKPLVSASGALTGWRGVLGDVSERQAAQERLEYMAGYDALTGLANRRLLRDRVQRVLDGKVNIVHRDAGVGPSALLYIDVDHFKDINDTMGHAIGDAVLQIVARRLMASSRLDDFIVRLGGDEFALVVNTASGEAEVMVMAERLLHALREPTEIAGQTVAITASIGVALMPLHGDTVDEILGNADLALYAAKHAGRACASLYAPQLGERNRRRRLLERELSSALANGELSLLWQPQRTADLAALRGAEVLLRWSNPRLGDVEPTEFIPIAEDTGLIEEIGGWVLSEACRMASAELDVLQVSVNVSPRQLQRADFVQRVENALTESGLEPGRLELEITESLFMKDAASSLRKMHKLREIGVRIALDDFGTGYSSLAYLRRFPFDTLKIDRAFVRELTHQSDARAIVRMIIELATTLGMQTVAECVEEEAQLKILQGVGCQSVQGNLVARPMSIHALQAMLRAQRPSSPRLMA